MVLLLLEILLVASFIFAALRLDYGEALDHLEGARLLLEQLLLRQLFFQLRFYHISAQECLNEVGYVVRALNLGVREHFFQPQQMYIFEDGLAVTRCFFPLLTDRRLLLTIKFLECFDACNLHNWTWHHILKRGALLQNSFGLILLSQPRLPQ